MTGRFTGSVNRFAVLGLAALLAGCAGDDGLELPKIGDLNPFKEKQTPLPGRRIALIQGDSKVPGEMADASQPVTLPPVRINENWSQPGGEPNNAPGNLALGATIHEAWRGDAGTGSTNKGRVTATPIVADGRVFTLDADGLVSAFPVGGGSAIWRTQLAGAGEAKGTGYGGGLAVDGGRLYGASGYGYVAALDPATGQKYWDKNVGAPIRTSPTAVGDRVYVVSSEGRFLCFSATDGSELWTARGLSQTASLINNASPAVDGDTVIAPFSSGDLVALNVADGTAKWTESLTRSKQTSQLSSLTDVARPAIDGGVVYAVGHGGRMIATRIATGERVWTSNIAGTQTPWVAGETVFVLDTSGQLFALARGDGKVQWTTQLPTAKVWSGPTLAGGLLWVVSNKGQLIGVDAATGKPSSEVALGDNVYIAPVVAGGRMFVLSDKAKLIALN